MNSDLLAVLSQFLPKVISDMIIDYYVSSTSLADAVDMGPKIPNMRLLPSGRCVSYTADSIYNIDGEVLMSSNDIKVGLERYGVPTDDISFVIADVAITAKRLIIMFNRQQNGYYLSSMDYLGRLHDASSFDKAANFSLSNDNGIAYGSASDLGAIIIFSDDAKTVNRFAYERYLNYTTCISADKINGKISFIICASVREDLIELSNMQESIIMRVDTDGKKIDLGIYDLDKKDLKKIISCNGRYCAIYGTMVDFKVGKMVIIDDNTSNRYEISTAQYDVIYSDINITDDYIVFASGTKQYRLLL